MQMTKHWSFLNTKLTFITDSGSYPLSLLAIGFEHSTYLGYFYLDGMQFSETKAGYLTIQGVRESSNTPVTFYYFGVVTKEIDPAFPGRVEFKYTHRKVEESQSGIKCIKCQSHNASVSFHIFFVASQKFQIQNMCNACSEEHWKYLQTLEEFGKGSITVKDAMTEKDIRRIENEANYKQQTSEV